MANAPPGERGHAAALRTLGIHELQLQDEASFRHVALYADLKARLFADGYQVQVLPTTAPRWDHALLLNLAFWDARGGGDTLVDDVLPADVVCHMAWHHLAAAALADGDAPLSAEAMLLGESIASAFDLYLLGRLVGFSPDSDFVQTQLPAMADVAESAGVDNDAFETLVLAVRDDPERAFEDLRRLLYDVSTELLAATDADAALAVLLAHDDDPFACLLHHFEIANWLHHARAAPVNGSTAKAVALDATLRASSDSVDWLTQNWLL
jgi:hypothetical protein